MSIETIITMLAGGMVTSLQIFCFTLVGALPLGLLVSLGRGSSFTPLRWFVRFYISVMRGTPLILQLFIVYFGPYYIFGLQMGQDFRFTATLIAFILNYAAYFGEIFRSGIESIPHGQYEAAAVLGYSRTQTFVRIILPQVFKRIIPPLTNEIITLVKDTALAFTLGVAEMFTQAKAIVSSQGSLLAFLIAGIFYYVFNALVAFIMERVEKAFAYYHE
ncbi:MAG: amino acid ABC transporter permease [Coriobacteriales bacterium]|jgi:His/Glu/Gln/Arg/opine family amino acid ABC transporter permease subunit|nr:amino acid ABC transporter permease [Coriobacteriales bacterium]